MNISFNWLCEFFKLDLKIDEVSNILTDIGLEVEGIKDFQEIKGNLDGLVVGEVIECSKHPDADRLKITKVDIGSEVLQIVCGAPNVAINQKVVVATVGSTLFPINGEKFKINKSKIRGKVSQGMICAEDEIGLSSSHDGIIVLDNKFKKGEKFNNIYKNYTDKIINIGLTPNRSDAMSHYGVARDLRAALIHKGIKIELITPSVSVFHINSKVQKLNVHIDDYSLCPRFMGVCIDNIIINESPKWLQNKLKAIGLSPLNNVVDITNYVLHEMGQPLHAYDLNKISSKTIHVKTLKEKTKFETLDGISRDLSKDNLMICDKDIPMCIAGVFGGSEYGIKEDTKSIFLESAYFDPVSIRKTAKFHSLNTDASFRFERGICIDTVEYALKRAAILICEIAHGQISSNIIDEFPKRPKEKSILLNFEKINKLIGDEIPREKIKSILTSLDFKINNITETGVGITIPFYRHDVSRECDVVEEILRIYGYNEISLSNNLSIPINNNNLNLNYKVENIISNLLIPFGFNEIINNSLTNNKLNIRDRKEINILNSISSDVSQLRTTLIDSALKTLQFNLNRKNSNTKFFEFGKIYEEYENKTLELKRLGITFFNDLHNQTWNNNSKNDDFYILKNLVLNIFKKLSISVNQKEIEHDGFSKSLGLFHKKNKIAIIGEINNKFKSIYNIKKNVFYSSLDIDMILNLCKTGFKKYKTLSKYPSVKRELNFLIDKKINYNSIEKLILDQSNIKNLSSMSLSDVFEDKKLPDGKKSYTLEFILTNNSKTLSEKEISNSIYKIQTKIESEFNAILRSQNV